MTLVSQTDVPEEIATLADVALRPTSVRPMRANNVLRAVMPELDSLRGLAVLIVVLYHGLFWSAHVSEMHGVQRYIVASTQGGWLGVQLFFVLSGFLITGILLDTRTRPDYLSRFYRRRARRILPAYVALLVVLAILGQAQWRFLLLSLLFAANLTSSFGIPMQYGPLWSLAVEEQFYLLWPVVVRRLRVAHLAALSLAIVLFTPVLRLVAFKHGMVEELYSRTWFVSDGLAVGALLAIFLRSRLASRRRLAQLSAALLLTGSLLLGFGMRFGILHRTTLVGAALQLAPWHLLFGGLLMAELLLGSSVQWGWTVQWRFLAFLGRISYGLYLIHLLVFELYDAIVLRLSPTSAVELPASLSLLGLRLIVCSGAAILISYISRETLEEFFLGRALRQVRG